MAPRSGIQYVLALLVIASITAAQDHIRVIDNRHSFKPPYFLVGGGLLNWEITGSTVISEEYVRLTPAIKSRVGGLWSTEPVRARSWEIELDFRIGGGGKIGADGMALWYTRQSKIEGPVFGNQDRWEGLGIIFDTFDNDGQRDNPQITAVYNDGTKEWRDDGKGIQFGGCRAEFRNPYKNVKAKIKNVEGAIEVLTYINDVWEPCIPPTFVNIPVGFYIGLTAATGGLFDNHDVYSLETTGLVTRAEANLPLHLSPIQSVPVPVPPTPPPSNQPAEAFEQQQEWPQQGGDQQAPYEDSLKKLEALSQAPSHNRPPSIPQPGQPVTPLSAAAPPPAPPAQVVPQSQDPQQQQQQQQQQQEQPPPQQQPPQQPAPPPQQQLPGTDLSTITAKLESIDNRLASLHQITNTKLNNPELRTELAKIRDQQSVIAQSLADLLRNAPTRNDVDSLKQHVDTSVSAVSQEQAEIKAFLNEFKAVVNRVIGGRTDEISKYTEETNQAIRYLKQVIEATQQSTKQIAGNLQQNTADLAQTIEKSSSFGFWSYFLFVQAIFIFGFIWWRKQRDDANKKLI